MSIPQNNRPAPEQNTAASVLAPLACPQCGVEDTPSLGPGNGPHAFRALCRHCGVFVQWVSTRPPADREARRQLARQEAMAQKPPTARQLWYLARLGDQGAAPTSMLDASERIDTLVHGEVVK